MGDYCPPRTKNWIITVVINNLAIPGVGGGIQQLKLMKMLNMLSTDHRMPSPMASFNGFYVLHKLIPYLAASHIPFLLFIQF